LQHLAAVGLVWRVADGAYTSSPLSTHHLPAGWDDNNGNTLDWNGAGDWDGLLMAYRNNRFAALW